MALQTNQAGWLEQIGIVLCSMYVMATKTSHSVRVHLTGDKVVSLHPIFVGGSIGEVGERGFPEFVLFQVPEALQIQTNLQPDRPVVVFPIDRARGVCASRLPL